MLSNFFNAREKLIMMGVIAIGWLGYVTA